MNHLFLLIALIPALAHGFTPFRACTGGRPGPHTVRVVGCTSAPCDVIQGTDANMQIDFRAAVAAATLRPVVFGTAFGATVEYQLPPQFHNGCNHLLGGSRCPISLNEDVTYNFVFPMHNNYPPVPVTVEIALLNQANQAVFCALIDVHVRLR